jgi:hypothetical protein
MNAPEKTNRAGLVARTRPVVMLEKPDGSMQSGVENPHCDVKYY